TGRTMCDRIVVFDAPLRLVGRLVDVDIQAAGAWSLAGDVADGLAQAVPLDHLFAESERPAPGPGDDIDLKAVTGRGLASTGSPGSMSGTMPIPGSTDPPRGA
ncbi:MAG: hypothetical protein ACKOHG_17105, partial [Planctomycetia bacterium]